MGDAALIGNGQNGASPEVRIHPYRMFWPGVCHVGISRNCIQT